MSRHEPPEWFRPRGYRHLDRPVSFGRFGKLIQKPNYVARHAFLPLIRFVLETPRYDTAEHKTEIKGREIFLASHRDAHIYTYYSSKLLAAYERYLSQKDFSNAILAYRKLGKDNVDFALEAFAEVEDRGPCEAICFDVSKFFDTIDHSQLKKRVETVLGEKPLPPDWYAVLKNATRFSYVEKGDLDAQYGLDIKGARNFVRYCTIEKFRNEIRSRGLVHPSPRPTGVAQGLPISSCLSNVYMIDLDEATHLECGRLGASYRRYSDDILIITEARHAQRLEEFIHSQMLLSKLRINESKTDRVTFHRGRKFLRASKPLQYLGLTFDGKRKLIRSASISRFARRIVVATKIRKRQAAASIVSGKTARLYKRAALENLSHLARGPSFHSYAKKVARKSGSRRARRQMSRYWSFLMSRLQ